MVLGDIPELRPGRLFAITKGVLGRPLSEKSETAIVTVVLSIVVCGLSIFDSWKGDPLQARQHLGAEYFNIARALAEGRGYSDPFGEPTGPTAWMPPIYPLMLAGLLLLVKTRIAVATTVVWFTNLALIAIGVGLYRVARARRQCMPPWIVILLYAGWLTTYRFWFFTLTHDVWLITLGSGALIIVLHRTLSASRVHMWQWGLLGGVIALTSTALAAAWASASVALAWQINGVRRSVIAAAVVAAAVALPWSVRNAVTFHRLIPVKSNLYFDAATANVVDDDGVYDLTTMAKHPNVSLPARFEYATLGETAFVDRYRGMFRQSVARNPGALLTKIGHRAVASMLWYRPLGEGTDSPSELVWRRLVYPLPWLGLVAALWFGGPHRRFLRISCATTFAYLAPYIFIAFYIRYLLPLTPAMMLFAFFGLDGVLALWFVRGAPARAG